jgi:hypothetical protein
MTGWWNHRARKYGEPGPLQREAVAERAYRGCGTIRIYGFGDFHPFG